MSLPSTPSINIIFGPMYCSKTSEVIRMLIIYHEIKMKVLYINSILDNRADEAFSTHNETIGKVPFDAIKLKTLREQDVSQYSVIAVDEAQFFPDLKDTVLNWVDNLGKIVIVAGLNGDFRRHPFGQINDLISYADTVTKLSSICSVCIKKAIMKVAHFTKRTILNDDEILIGGKETYIPVCRSCYLE
jgi:thymidine kinase